MLGHLGMHPDHLIPRTTYLKNEIPIAGVAHQAGTVRFGADPATSVARRQLQGARARQPVRRRHQLLPEHRRGEPGPHGDRQRAAGRRPPARAARRRGGRPGEPRGRRRRRRRLAARRRRCPSRWPVDRRSPPSTGGPRPGRGAGHVPGRQLDPHQPVVLRPDEHGLRGAVPAPGGRGDLGGAGRGAAHAAGSASSGCSWRGSSGDLAAMSLLVVSQFAIGPGALPYLILLLATTSLGIGFGLTVPALNNLRGGVLPGGGGPGGAVPQRAARAGHGAGAGARRGVPRARPLVGPARSSWRALTAGLLAGQPRACRSPWTPRPARRPGARERRGAAAGVLAVRRRSRCSTGSSRRRTATGRRST